jgi:hypothetical protein
MLARSCHIIPISLDRCQHRGVSRNSSRGKGVCEEGSG